MNDKRLHLLQQQITILSRANQQINRKLEVPAVMRSLVEAALELTGALDGAAGLMVDDQILFREYCRQWVWTPIKIAFPPGYGVPGWVITNKRPYIANDPANDPCVIQDIRQRLGFYNLINIPVLNNQGELLGCIEIHNTANRRAFDEQDVILLQGLAASAAVAIENSRMVTRLKATQKELLESERKYRSLFENSPASLWEEDLSGAKSILDALKRQGIEDFADYFSEHPEVVRECVARTRILDVNKATLALFHAGEKAELLRSIGTIFTEQSLEALQKALTLFAAGETRFSIYGFNQTLAGEEIEVNLHFSVMPGYEKSLEKVIIAMIDVTQERQIDRMKSEFIATAAHELRTPLSVILGFAELLQQDLQETSFGHEQRREFLTLINEKALSLDRIVDDLLDVRRIETGRPLQLVKEPVDVLKMCHEVARIHQRETTRHTISVNAIAIDQVVLLDGPKLLQVLDNLLNNAVKYSPQGGDIRLHAELADQHLVIRVADQGIGLTTYQKKRIFEKFYRVDYSDKAPRGLGLGLSIAHQIVEAHGGRLRVDSAIGAGTTFTLSVPLDTAPVQLPLG
jgi:signal transduction histidine kinase